MLAPLRQHLRRDSHPERLALLELLGALTEDEELGSCEARSDFDDVPATGKREDLRFAVRGPAHASLDMIYSRNARTTDDQSKPSEVSLRAGRSEATKKPKLTGCRPRQCENPRSCLGVFCQFRRCCAVLKTFCFFK